LKEATVDSEAELYEVARLIAVSSKKLPAEDTLRPIVDKMLEKCPLALQERTSADDTHDVPDTITLNYLVGLNGRIERAVHAFERDKARYRFLLVVFNYLFQTISVPFFIKMWSIATH
jgi:hypothetical protein